jgi:hypothetical protein
MNRVILLPVALLLLTGVLIGQEAPDWAKRDYAAPVNQVFTAALKSIQEQRHEVKSKDDTNHTVDFHVGITAWSWGYNMRLAVTPIDERHSRVVIGVSRSGGKALSWGSGEKEVRKILAGIDAELASQKEPGQPAASTAKPASTAEPSAAQVEAPGTVWVVSNPDGGDVYSDGEFVGNTPSTLKLSAGKHTIRVTASGYKEWSREITVQSGSDVKLNAVLEKK